jgi:hypothetical protein
MKESVTVLVDGDPLVYRVGFSLETRVWYTEWVDVDANKSDDPVYDDVHVAKFYNAASRDRFCYLQGLHPDEVAHTLVPVPTGEEAIVFGRVKQSLRDIEQHVAEYLATQGQEIGEFRIFLTGTDNFRDKVATIKKYKGNRDKSIRPYWYQEIRNYLENRWGAEVVNGMEADDAVSILQWQAEEGGTIICTIDKDLENVPGHFYNYATKEAKYISYPEGMLHFYRQMITGDSTDNIPGCHLIGKKGAEKILDKYTTEKDMWLKVLDTYIENIRAYPEHHAPHTTARGSAIENGILLWMLTEEDEVWSPPV